MKKIILALALTIASTQAQSSPECIGWTGIYLRAMTYEIMCQVDGKVSQNALNMMMYNGCVVEQSKVPVYMNAHKAAFDEARGSMTTEQFCHTDKVIHTELGL